MLHGEFVGSQVLLGPAFGGELLDGFGARVL